MTDLCRKAKVNNMLVTKFSPPPRCKCGDEDLTSFEMRETTGKDESNAASNTRAKGAHGNQIEELICAALVSINGKPVNVDGKPYDQFGSWNSRARAFALKAWTYLNGVAEGEETPFVESAVSVLKV